MVRHEIGYNPLWQTRIRTSEGVPATIPASMPTDLAEEFPADYVAEQNRWRAQALPEVPGAFFINGEWVCHPAVASVIRRELSGVVG